MFNSFDIVHSFSFCILGSIGSLWEQGLHQILQDFFLFFRCGVPVGISVRINNLFLLISQFVCSHGVQQRKYEKDQSAEVDIELTVVE